MNKPITVLDCTLRDGGYYNRWDFDFAMTQRLVSALAAAGVDIIELGYKSIPVDGDWCGLYKYCREEFLERLDRPAQTRLAFMIDVKEFVPAGAPTRSDLDRIITRADESMFDWVRLAAGAKHADATNDLVTYFRDLGYGVTVNLMGMSLLTAEERHRAFSAVSRAEPDVLYFADSFGSMYPSDVRGIVSEIRDVYGGRIGFHAHENQGMAFANTLSAIDAGVEFVDATVCGMGRGAGNLQMEQLLLWLSERHRQGLYQPNDLLPLIEEVFEPWKHEYGWGHSYVYMLSGLKNIHPSYCQNISEGNRFSMSQISRVVDQIPGESRRQFDKQELDAAVNRVLVGGAGESESQFPPFVIETPSATRDCLMVAPGRNVKRYAGSIADVIEKRGMAVVECNYSGAFSKERERLLVIFNEMRLKETLEQHPDLSLDVVTGVKACSIPENKARIRHFDYEIGALQIAPNAVRIPDFEAGQYAITLAIAMGYRNIYLAGFSGYGEPHRDKPMDDFFLLLRDAVPEVRVRAVTPTLYRNVQQYSIYGL